MRPNARLCAGGIDIGQHLGAAAVPGNALRLITIAVDLSDVGWMVDGDDHRARELVARNPLERGFQKIDLSLAKVRKLVAL